MSAVAAATATVANLAADAPKGPEFGKASPIALLLVVVLLVASGLLVWSMNRHIRKLPKSFDPEHPEPDQAADDGTDLKPELTSDAPGTSSSSDEKPDSATQ